jgi:hypothetical protein
VAALCVPQCEANGWDATAAKLMAVAEAKDHGRAALELGVSLGLLEIYRPVRKRTDWYRLASITTTFGTAAKIASETGTTVDQVNEVAAFLASDVGGTVQVSMLLNPPRRVGPDGLTEGERESRFR